jgi:hypothetical protein
MVMVIRFGNIFGNEEVGILNAPTRTSNVPDWCILAIARMYR